ncbi:DUF3152 domain-containing protein [Streptomyces physcomitrii]|uniref:DUF3152 domain-containing protein n=1 Tax=Streptomyces physcomitrii TaxID=2724184 RepID=UPI0033CB7B23
MGRHRRRGPADNSDTGALPVVPGAAGGRGRRRRDGATDTPPDGTPALRPEAAPAPRPTPAPRPATGPSGATPPPGTPRPRTEGTPAHGTPRPSFDGTPAHGMPRPPFDGTPAQGTPRVRGGHPEQREAGGGWGRLGGGPGQAGPPRGSAPTAPSGRPVPSAPSAPAQATTSGRGAAFIPAPRPGGPRQDYLDAFDDESVFTPRSGAPTSSATGSSTALPPDPTPAAEPEDEDVALDTRTTPRTPDDTADTADQGPGEPRRARARSKSRAMTGIAAAAVTTVLAVVVAGQFAGRDDDARAQGAAGGERDKEDSASRSDRRPTPADSKPHADPKPVTYAEKMATVFPLDAKLDGPGDFEAVPGFAKAPGKGQLFRYRIDVEKGLGLDSRLFATAVQKTLNDERSWAHGGGRTFERVSSGTPDFVITLASPGTTADWCAKSGLDTTQDNVSCDSAATDRVMINAYRWAQGAETFGDKLIHPYRQMLINHEVGHRLGFNHVTCTRDGALAPVMQQQTKFLSYEGISCKPNAWVYPNS